MSELIPCILAGGAGTRLWPVSREARPKPFMRMADQQSLLQKTFLRASQLPEVKRLLTVTNRELLFSTQDDYRDVNQAALHLEFILEPCGRNTAVAIAAAALYVQQEHGDQAQLLVLPADHLIHDQDAFAAAVSNARSLASAGYLVTFGIQPDRAETGFGYIELGKPLEHSGYQAARFVEKPDAVTAQGYLDGGCHLWNAGMFCLQVDHLLNELHLHAPAVLDSARDSLAARR